MAEIYDVLARACGGMCYSTSITWEDIRRAAETKWGLSSPKYTHFLDQAWQNGVDH